MEPVIILQAVTKVYDSGDVRVNALRGIDLEIARGEFVAVMGSSGSGKSTLMNILGCLDRPSSGRYVLAGSDVAHLDDHALAQARNRLLGFVFQSFHLLARTTALENVELPLVYAGCPRHERRERAAAALQRMGLGDRMHHHPNQLSGGQQQRVAIARALVCGPKVLLADEPTGNLDSQTSVEIMDLFRQVNQLGITLVVVTHEPEIAKLAGRLVVLKDGAICSDEPAPGKGRLFALAGGARSTR